MSIFKTLFYDKGKRVIQNNNLKQFSNSYNF